MTVAGSSTPSTSYRALPMGDRVAVIHENASAIRISELEADQAEALAAQLVQAVARARAVLRGSRLVERTR